MKNNKQETTKPTIDEIQHLSSQYLNALERIKICMDTQKQQGIYDSNQYMYGMLIGLECAYFAAQNIHDFEYTNHPKQFLDDLKKMKPQIQNVFPDEE